MLQLASAIWLVTAVGQPAASAPAEWLWHRDTPACSVFQSVSADGQRLSASRTPGTNGTIISIEWSDAVSPSQNARAEALPGASVKFDPGGPTNSQVWVSKDARSRLYLSVGSDDPAFMSKFSAASAVEIAHGRIGTVRVPIRSASTAAYGLRNCEDSKMQKWGIDPVAWRRLKAHPIPVKPLVSWLKPEDYPRRALAYGLQGWVVARLDVGSDGAVRDCRPLNPDLYSGFRDTICYAMKKRARFQPARDSNDNVVAAPYVVIVRFLTY